MGTSQTEITSKSTLLIEGSCFWTSFFECVWMNLFAKQFANKNKGSALDLLWRPTVEACQKGDNLKKVDSNKSKLHSSEKNDGTTSFLLCILHEKQYLRR